MPVLTQDIEKAMTDLWAVDKDVSPSKSLGLQRVYTTNLVAYVSDQPLGFEVESALLDMVNRHPGRYILLRPARDLDTEPVRFFVSGHCRFSVEKERQACTDMVQLVAHPQVLDHLYSFTQALLVPDLPVEFWWPGDLALDNPFFKEMAVAADRVWLNSSRFESPEASLSRLAWEWEGRFPTTTLGDLNWVRTQRWRALIAELFDGPCAGYLRHIRRLVVEYGEKSLPLRSLYIACWMASRLGWKYRGRPLTAFPEKLEFETAEGKAEVILKATSVKDPKRNRISGVFIETDGETPGSFSVVRDEDPEVVLAQSTVGGRKAHSRAMYFDHLVTSEVLNEGMNRLGPDRAWNEALAMARTILKKP